MDWKKLLSIERIRKSSKNENDIRNEFESDFGRIIFSPALRRMHDKTQVFPLTTDDNIHSRLTHSNEVMSIGYTFGLKLSKNEIIQKKTGKSEVELLRIFPVILKNVCLIHDIGNSPFGHFGETIISNYFENLNNNKFNTLSDQQKRDFINYDGNAQGLRVLSKLQILDDIFGLNLTYATLASYLKYPNYEIIDKNVIEKSKHGIFYSEIDFFHNIVEACDLKKGERYLRHPLCYLMEAADSIAYCIMDIEDGFNSGLLDINYIKSQFEDKDMSSAIIEKVYSICEDNKKEANSKIVDIRISLMNYLVDKAFCNFIEHIEDIENGKYNKELIKDDSNGIAEILSTICKEKIFSSRKINYLETTGYAVLVGLLDYYIKFLFHEDKKFRRRAKSLISKSIIKCAIEENLKGIYDNRIKMLKIEKENSKSEKERIEKEEEICYLETNDIKNKIIEYESLVSKQMKIKLGSEEYKKLKKVKKEIYKVLKPEFDDLDNYFKFRVIIDFISGMTDQYALNQFQRVSGQRIN